MLILPPNPHLQHLPSVARLPGLGPWPHGQVAGHHVLRGAHGGRHRVR